MKNNIHKYPLIILFIAAITFTLKADDTTALDLEIGGATPSTSDDTTYYVGIPAADDSKNTVTITGTGDDLSADNCSLTCTACDGTNDDPTEDGDAQWDMDYDAGDQDDYGVITWDVDNSTDWKSYEFTLNSVSQDYKCPSGDDQSGDNTAEDDNGSQTYSIIPVPTVSVVINTFIPANNVWGPPIIYPDGDAINTEDVVFQGDNTSLGVEHGSHKTQYSFSLIPCQELSGNGLVSSPVKDIGQTVEYDRSSSLDSRFNLSSAALSDTVLGDRHLKIDQGTASSDGLSREGTLFLTDTKCQIECTCSVSNPISSGSSLGPIAYDFTITIDYADPSNPSYTVAGNYGAFPAYEIYINDTSVFSYDPASTRSGPLSLLLGMVKHANKTDTLP